MLHDVGERSLKYSYTLQHKNNKENSYYVYVHRRIGGDPFYVGKGSCYRAWSTSGRNHYWQRVVNKHGLEVEIVFDGLTSEEAYQLEKDTILEFRYFGYALTNLTSGGEGGLEPSDETREKQSAAKRGKKPHNFGKKQPSTSKEKSCCADLTVYTFIHDSGEVFTGTRYQLVEAYPNVPLDKLGKLFYKKPRYRVRGWRLYKEQND